jgi:hypothetical protein
LRNRLLRFYAVTAACVVAACAESLESEVGCPLLCPSQSLDVREVVLDAVEYDATVRGFPPLGAAPYFVLARSGDSLESRMVVRFDSLPDTYTIGGVTTPVTGVDSANLRFFIDTAATRSKATVTLELYDVDTTAADADFDAVNALFRPDRFITSHILTTLPAEDTVNVAVPNALLLTKILAQARRLRIGIRIVSDSTARIVPVTANQLLFPRLRYDPAPENTDYGVIERPPRSFTPVDDPQFAVNFTDYQVPVAGAFPLTRATSGSDTIDVFRDSILVAGGVEGRRIYLRFSVPDSILETSIIRATLILQKRATPDFGVRDTIALVPQAVLAKALLPPSRAVLLTDTSFAFPMPSNRMEPRATGEIRMDMVGFSRAWTKEFVEQIPLALSLRVGLEGRTMQELHFYSTSAAAHLRPRLRVTFVPRLQVGPP